MQAADLLIFGFELLFFECEVVSDLDNVHKLAVFLNKTLLDIHLLQILQLYSQQIDLLAEFVVLLPDLSQNLLQVIALFSQQGILL